MGLMDIVEFVEKVCEFSLTDFQKEFVRKVYDAAKNDKRLYYVPPRCNQKFSFELLQAKLKEKIQGAIYVKVNENDSLVIKVTRRDGNNFDMSFTDFANRMLNGLTTDYTAYEVVQKYKKFVMTQFFK